MHTIMERTSPEKGLEKGKKRVDSRNENHITQGELPHITLPTCDDRLIWDVWASFFHLPALTVADELGLFSFLKRTPATAEEVSQIFSLKMRATESLLGVLASLGFLVQRQNRFYVTDVSRNFLLPESPYYWGGMLHACRDLPNMHFLIEDTLQRDESLLYETEDIKISGKVTNLWEHEELGPEQAEFLTRVMHSHSFPAAIGVAQWGDFTDVRHLLDVGGGSGCFCIALALHYPEMQFTVMELPSVCELAEQYITAYGLQHQITTVAVDMFTDPWPFGYDGIFFSNIFHDWDREHCLHLGKRCFEVLPSGGHIYLHELLLSDTRDNPLMTASYSMAITLFYGNTLFTTGELDELLRECGFEDISVTHTYGYYSLVSGRKP